MVRVQTGPVPDQTRPVPVQEKQDETGPDLFQTRPVSDQICVSPIKTGFLPTESYSQRAAVRSALAQDPDWLEQYISKAIPMVTAQTNEVTRLLPWRPLQAPPTNGGVFELQRFHMKPGGLQVWGQTLKDYILSHDAPGLGKLIGAFYNNIGANNTGKN